MEFKKTEILRAIVIDNEDPNQLSRVKVKILPHLKDLRDNDLPWAEPYYKQAINAQTGIGEHNVPEIDSRIWVQVDWVTNNYEYLHAEYVEGFNIYNEWSDIESEIPDIQAQTYPQPNSFKLFPDGSCAFRNTSDGTMGFYNSNGTYITFKEDGGIVVYGKDKDVKFYNDEMSFNIASDGILELTSTNDITIQNDNTSVQWLNDNKKLIADADGVNLELDGTDGAKKFTLTDGTNTIESATIPVPKVTINGHLEVSV
jgi:hypothetical protein